MKEKTRQFNYFLSFFFFLFILDASIKHLIRQTGGFYVCNFGIAWGIKLPNIFFWLIWAILNFFLFFLLFRKKAFLTPATLAALSLIATGSVANLMDRLFFGCVTDFLKLPLNNFPFFNLADIYISTGCGLLFIHNLFTKPRA